MAENIHMVAWGWERLGGSGYKGAWGTIDFFFYYSDDGFPGMHKCQNLQN